MAEYADDFIEQIGHGTSYEQGEGEAGITRYS
jgi:hypothetical protein